MVVDVFSTNYRLLLQEGSIISEMLARGIYFISRLQIDSKMYYPMFFNLSIGIERLLKLIIITDSFVRNDTTYKNYIRNNTKQGHDLLILQSKINEILQFHPECNFNKKNIDTEIHKKIIFALSDFAKKDRYYNIDVLVQKEGKDPIKTWNKDVMALLEKKYKPNKSLSKTESNLLNLIKSHSVAIYKENVSFENRYLKNKILSFLEKYQRLYILQIIREYASFLIYLADLSIKNKNDDIPYFRDIFANLIQDDIWYKSHKTYSFAK